jgi:hypothetical protein
VGEADRSVTAKATDEHTIRLRAVGIIHGPVFRYFMVSLEKYGSWILRVRGFSLF